MNHRSDHLGILSAILAGSLILLASRCSAAAPPITFSICEGQTLTFRQPAGTDKLEVRCPGNPLPVLTIAGCVGPHVTRIGDKYTATCDKMVTYITVKP